MPNSQDDIKQTAISRLRNYGESPLGPMLLATLALAQHIKPPQALPLMFPPVLVFSAYMNQGGYKTEAAGLSGAWSGLYALLASRRRYRLGQKFGVRGILRGTTMAVAVTNAIAGGVAWGLGRSTKEDD